MKGSPDISSLIHSTAIVDCNANLGRNISIGPYSIVEKGAVIQDNCNIGSHVTIKSVARIGKECQIFQGAIIGEIPQDLKFEGEETTIEIGDGTTIREFCTLNRGTKATGKTSIGKEVLLMAYVHLGHDCYIGDKCILANGISLGGHVEIGYHVTIGGHTPVHQFCKIGDHAFIGGSYRVVQDIPPYILVTGEPLKYAGINSIGLRRRGFSKGTRSQIKKAYQFIYRSGLNVTHATDKIKNELELTPEIQTILNFIENSTRGLV